MPCFRGSGAQREENSRRLGDCRNDPSPSPSEAYGSKKFRLAHLMVVGSGFIQYITISISIQKFSLRQLVVHLLFPLTKPGAEMLAGA